MSGASESINTRYENTIAVLGASGFIGSSLVLYLMQLGNKLHLLINETDPGITSLRGQVQTFNGSINNIDALNSCFEGCDAVYHLVGIIAETRSKSFQKTVIEGTQDVVRAAKNAGVKKIYYLSALGAEENADSKYHQSKWYVEQAIIESGLDYTIFRPSVVFGPGDKFINQIIKMVRYSPLIPVIGDGLYKLQPVYVEELCAVMADAARRTESSKQIYEIGGAEQLTYMEIVDIIKRVTGIKKTAMHIPVSLMKTVAMFMELVLKPAPLTIDQLKMMAAGSTCDNSVVEKEFGVTFSSLESQILNYMER
ncbi:MAG: complex I NDUFA9 subunit family protein [candidate division Zixibacteria bacterium]|nr:complex I NDUFA9 subunit family protein [candidate division Zixibacteria bacterium]